ncbi:MAG TPA: hypothetical protein VGC72_05555 [Candidatus Elarobacter sp.]|jgi:hypothetical protein
MAAGADLPPERDGLTGAVFWVCFGVLVLLLTHPSWFEHWERKDTLDLLIAAGTLGLAVATAASVRVTRSMFVQDHVRHRQRLMPIIRIGLARDPGNHAVSPGLLAKNIGTGPALHIWIRAAFTGGAPPLVDEIAGLGVGEERGIAHKLPNLPHKRSVYGAIEIRYEDVFGNRYSTNYDNFATLRFTFAGPDELR